MKCGWIAGWIVIGGLVGGLVGGTLVPYKRASFQLERAAAAAGRRDAPGGEEGVGARRGHEDVGPQEGTWFAQENRT